MASPGQRQEDPDRASQFSSEEKAQEENPQGRRKSESPSFISDTKSSRSFWKPSLSISSSRWSFASGSDPSQTETRRSSVSAADHKIRDKVTGKGKSKAGGGGMEELPGDEDEYKKMKDKDVKKEQKRQDYERLGLDKKVKQGSTSFTIQ